jgi:mRNA interferase MazF
MKRGEIYYATLDPTIGSEIAKLRPVLIVSNDINNRVATTITILLITSNVTKVYPFEVALSPADSGLPKACDRLFNVMPKKIRKLKVKNGVFGIGFHL